MSEQKKKTCEWEACTENAVHRLKWTRDPKEAGFDFAVYCDAHQIQARLFGAAYVECLNVEKLVRAG